MNHLAPIALFVYNRPQHTRRTLAFLKKNLLADESRLFIFSDAAATEKDEDKVNETRELIQNLDGLKSIRITERKTNIGLAANIIDEVRDIVKFYGKVYVMDIEL